MEIIFKGTPICFSLRKVNYEKLFGEPITDSLVQYNSTTQTVTVDERATDSYAIHAAMHECICCGQYGHLAPKTTDPDKRCSKIDKMLIDSMIDVSEKMAYIDKRIEMFETLLRKKLNPKMEKVFEESLRALKKLKLENTG